MPEKNFSHGHHEFPLTETLHVRVIFTDRQAQFPQIGAEAAAKHLEAAAAQIRAEAAATAETTK